MTTAHSPLPTFKALYEKCTQDEHLWHNKFMDACDNASEAKRHFVGGYEYGRYAASKEERWELISRAVNAHDAMREALERAKALLETFQDREWPNNRATALVQSIEQAKAALALASGIGEEGK